MDFVWEPSVEAFLWFTPTFRGLQSLSFCVLIIASRGSGGGGRRPTPFWCCPPVKYYWHDLWRRTAQNLPPDLAHFKKRKWGLENNNWLSIYSARLEEVLWQNDDFPAGLLGLTDLPLITTGAWQCLTRTTTLPHTARRSPLCHLECCCWWGGGGGEIFCFLSTPSYHSEWQLRPLCQLEHCAHN